MVTRQGSGQETHRSTALFVGRSLEVSTVAAQLDKARSGSPAIVVIEGPAGMGKTALVREVLRLASDFRVLAASADECESRLPGGVISQLMPEGGQDRGGAGLGPGDPFAIGGKLLDLLGCLQNEAPVVLVVDDVQWADTLSVQALAFALRRLQSDQVAALFVARQEPPGLPDIIRRLAAGERGVVLNLGGLDWCEMTALASAVIGRRLAKPTAQRLCAHTGGSPLHARALLEELNDGALEDTAGVLPAPSSFAMVVVARLAACATSTVNLLQAAAVLGQHCSLGAAAVVGGVDDPVSALEEAISAHLLEPRPHRQISFVHPLVRAAVYHDLGPSRRSALHTAAAAVVDGPGAIRHRIAGALVEDPVLAAEVEAHARQELAKGSLESGADALLSAARLTVDRHHRTGLMLDALEVLVSGGQIGQAMVVAEEVAAMVSARGRYLMGRLTLFSGRLAEAVPIFEEAWQRWDPAEEPGLGALIAADLAQVYSGQLRSAEAAEWARRAIEASSDPELTTTALSVLVPCLGRIGRPAEAFTAAAAPPGGQSQTSSVEIEALLGRGMVRMWVDDLEQAREDLSAVLAACRDRPASRQALVALGMLADTEYRLGAWDDSVAHGAQLVSLVEDSEQVWVGAFAHAAAGRALAPRGLFEQAEIHARAAARAGQVMRDATSIGCAATAAAQVAFFRGDFGAAAAAVQPMLDLGERAADDEPSVHPWRELHIEALLRLGRLEEAEAALEALEALAGERDRRSSLAEAARLRAGLEATRGRDEVARTAFEAAVVGAQDLQAPFELARAHDDYGSYLRRRGERKAAGMHLRAALEGFEALGATPLVDRCRQELTACGLTPSKRTDRPSTDLTPQELAVVRLVVAGRSNREIAAELVVSPKTVEYHLGHVYGKLGVRSRTQLTARLAAPAPRL